MKHYARTVALFALLGAIITALLAWMFAALGSVARPGRIAIANSKMNIEAGDWPINVPRHWPEPHLTVSLSGRGVECDHAFGTGLMRDYQVSVLRTGWPLKALQWTNLIVMDLEKGESHETLGWGIDVPAWLEAYAEDSTGGMHMRRRLPLEPVWPGFALNVAMFGGGLWLILRGRGAVRRHLRTKRGQCRECGYPIGSLQVCSECGRPTSNCKLIDCFIS